MPDGAVELTDESSDDLSAEELEVGALVVVVVVEDESSDEEVADFVELEAESVSVDEADEVREDSVVLESVPSSPPRRAERSPPPVEEEAASEDVLVRDRALVVVTVELTSSSEVEDEVAEVDLAVEVAEVESD